VTARYRAILESWGVVDLTTAIAESAVRLHSTLRLKLAEAVQAASAFAFHADAIVIHDHDVEPLCSRLHIIACPPPSSLKQPLAAEKW
jgi:hypothetical protein